MNREQLLASLTAGREDIDGVYFDGDLNGDYIDWSSKLIHDEHDDLVTGRTFEIQTSDGTVQLDMTWDRIERLQRALTLLLLERQD